jgi:hypothetical protein
MKTEEMIQEAGTTSEAKPDIRAQLAQHLAQGPESRRTVHRLMKVLEVAWLALIAGHLAWALYISFSWVGVPERIVAVWFTIPVSVSVLMILVGLHGAAVMAFFPVFVPSSSFPYVTGSRALGMGLGFAAVSLLVGGLWGTFAWAVWTTNWAILEPLIRIIGVLVAVGVVAAVASDLYKRFFRSR